MSRATLYRGDLLFLLETAGAKLPPQAVASLCGFEYSEENAKDEKPVELEGVTPSMIPAEPPALPAAPVPDARNQRFWRVVSHEVLSDAERSRRREVPAMLRDAVPLTNEDLEPVSVPRRARPLLHWSRLWPFLREVLGKRKRSRQPHLPQTVRLIASARPIVRLPRKFRRAWHPRVQLYLDQRPALAVFWQDYEHLVSKIKSMRGDGNLHIHRLYHAQQESLPLPRAEASVLVLGDLNQYQGSPHTDPWLLLGRRLRARGMSPWALCPCPRERWDKLIARTWNLALWDRGQRLPLHGRGLRNLAVEAPDQREAGVKRLFGLAAPAIQIEPSLLRDLRFLLPHTEADVGTEYDAFQSNETQGTTELSLRLDASQSYRRLLRFMSDDLLAQAVSTFRAHHEQSLELFRHMELVGLHDALTSSQWAMLLSRGIISTSDLSAAQAYQQRLVAGLHQESFDNLTSATLGFGSGELLRFQPDTAKGEELQVLWALAHQQGHRDLPSWVEPHVIAWLNPEAPLTTHSVRLAEGIVLGADRGFELGALSARQATCLVTLHTTAGQPLRLERPWSNSTLLPAQSLESATALGLSSDQETLLLKPMSRPTWATRMGYDQNGLWAESGPSSSPTRLRWLPPERGLDAAGREWVRPNGMFIPTAMPAWAEKTSLDAYGLAAEFRIRDVPFVLRWIPPGSFLMGSPEDEPGRYDDEGPRHEVTISQGYWVADTPVTQAQWRAVVEAVRSEPALWKKLNLFSKDIQPSPSRFKGPADLPVESVSWHTSQDFCRLLNALLPDGPGFHLPTEAQWEYACRAGTDTALYNGPITIKGENHAPELPEIAWYGGNSGLDLEVSNPESSKGWPNKQFDHQQAGTHRVKLKQANPWGLYDTLGNVWEWCEDAWDAKAYANRSAGVTDPRLDSAADSAVRVIRGGSWGGRARYCRSAYRFRDLPGFVWRHRGLRLAAGQNEPRAAEPQEKERSDLPERRSRARRAGGSTPA